LRVGIGVAGTLGERILLIEDEASIAESVAYSLRSEGFRVEIACDGLAGLSSLRAFSPDLVILDLMLPKLNGLDLCRTVRKESNVPIIMLTAKTEEVDRIVGLELGADDYVAKPFSMRELIARVRAVLRRTESLQEEDAGANLRLGAIEMDVGRRRVTVDGHLVHLPLKQFELLRLLMVNKDKVMSREELFKRVWDTDTACDTSSLDVHVRWLREKVEPDPGHPRYIRTIRGVGYKIVSSEE
jgi:DNA-binding response OmpR family regulator